MMCDYRRYNVNDNFIGFIYALLFEDGSFYIGQTTTNVLEYFSITYTLCKGKGRPDVHRMITKGIKYETKVLAVCNTKHDLNYLETKYILEYKRDRLNLKCLNRNLGSGKRSFYKFYKMYELANKFRKKRGKEPYDYGDHFFM